MERRQALKILTGLGIGTVAFQRSVAAMVESGAEINAASIAQAEWVAGIELDEEQREQVAEAVVANKAERDFLRQLELGPEVAPAFTFHVADTQLSAGEIPSRTARPRHAATLARPDDDQALAFCSVVELGGMLRRGEVTSLELTEFALERLRKYDPLLHCVVTLCEDLALEQAIRADEELAAGKDRGPLHGIPWGAKDLISVPGYPTTWGAPQYQVQQFETWATVAERLDEAGAVLVAKLSLGALAMGDQWFGGMTRCPWDATIGSSGSSAGSASAVAAGLVPFALGSETLGSIVSPSRRCGVVGFRPTFGRVSRAGCMPLSWTMDKIGPITRSVEDAALVFDAIHGADGIDRAALDRPFQWPSDVPLKGLRVGVIAARRDADPETFDPAAESRIAKLLADRGAELVRIELPREFPVWALTHVLEVESAAMFQGLIDKNDTEGLNAWPNIFRAARFTSAVEYVQLMRVRSLLMDQMAELMRGVDLYISQTDVGYSNLCGYPSIVIPTGVRQRGDRRPTPTTETLTGQLFEDDRLLGVAAIAQQALGLEEYWPPLDEQLEGLDTP
ncbi:MAG: amidase [Planctomycetales bacterium]|nr:amidase [Planctomycetales bacterium]